MLTCILTNTIYFIIYSIMHDNAITAIKGGYTIQQLLGTSKIILMFFSAIFLFYTSSGIMKTRKKEFGLFNVLGFNKTNISIVIAIETAFMTFVSTLVGVLVGSALYKLFFLLLLNLSYVEINKDIGQYSDEFSYLHTFIVFGVINLIIYIYSVIQIYKQKTIDLLKADKRTDTEPKAKIFTTVVGVVFLITGYFISLGIIVMTSDIIGGRFAVYDFIVAVLLVIVATFILFKTGSICLLKMLKNNKKYYYKPRNFISVSNMMFRMKRNAMGLASICILATATIVTLVITITLYSSVEENIELLYPRDVFVVAHELTEDKKATTKKIITENANKYDITIKDKHGFEGVQRGLKTKDDTKTAYILTVEEYNKMTDSNKTLAENQVIIYQLPQDDKLGKDDLLGFEIKEALTQFPLDTILSSYAINNLDTNVITPEHEMIVIANTLNNPNTTSYYTTFDIEGTEQNKIDYSVAIRAEIMALGRTYTEAMYEAKESLFLTYGGILFIGILFSIIFLASTVLIIYYKQISEGLEDKNRFEIIEKVGIDKKMIKQSINRQISTVFLLPIITAFIHLVFALPVMNRIVAMFGTQTLNQNIKFSVVAGVSLAFVLVYVITYKITVKVYYKITTKKGNR